MDVTHKAGKTLLKEIPNFYKSNPEFMGKRSQAIKEIGEMNNPLPSCEKPKKKKKPTETETNLERDKQLKL